MKFTSELFTRQTVVGLILIVLAALLLFSKFGLVESAIQSTKRTIENKVPAHVPLDIQIGKDKEEKIKTNKQWYRDFEMKITNTSDKPIYFSLSSS